MSNIFRLTKAEFVKIFKRPSIFIMAIILVATIFVSISIFNPTTRVDYTVTYADADNSQEYYDNFYDETVINSKYEFDNNFSNTHKIIEYYQALNTNTQLLTDYYNSLMSCITQLKNEGEPTIKAQLRYELVDKLDKFRIAYKTLDSMKEFSSITEMTLQTTDYQNYVAKNYYTGDACLKLDLFYSYANNNEYTPSQLIEIFFKEGNNYPEAFESILDNGINFIYTTFKGLTKEFNTFFDSYKSCKHEGLAQINNIKANRSNLEKVLKNYFEYYKLLADNEYPIIIVNKETNQQIYQKFEDALSYLNLSITDNENLNSHKSAIENLEKINISKFVNSLLNTESSRSNSIIQQVHISNKVVNDLISEQEKVLNNQQTILDNIEEKRTDESITNISKEITNYLLLQKSYDKLINTKILSYITKDLDNSTYNNFYNYGFETFNKYEAKELITLNTYYLNNNTYENSYLNNFSYCQDSGFKTNMYDFMYFSMEISTVVIIIFSMMLICNLITGETESGTIKLLLVRPYKRSKILTAKLLATIFFIITFMAFASIITLIGGFFLYSNTTLPILAVFNGYTAFEIQPGAMMLINIITLTLDVIFYSLLALMISILCKNFAASITCSLVLLLINFAFNVLFCGSFWYTLLPGMNLHLFKYFGNTFISTISANPIASTIQSLLITGIDTSMNFWFSVIFLGIYASVFITISYSVFHKRDF